MPFSKSLSRFNTHRLAIDPGSNYNQLYMSMWKLRKRWFSSANLSLISTWIISHIGPDKYGRTLIQICSALTDKWPIIDWLIKLKKIDINSKNLESGYTVIIYLIMHSNFDWFHRLYTIVYSMEESTILSILLKYCFWIFLSWWLHFEFIFFLSQGRCKYKSIRLRSYVVYWSCYTRYIGWNNTWIIRYR